MTKVLFVCIHNSARSQMAEALFTKYAPQGWSAQSAGLEYGKLNPLAIQVLKDEEGIDISQKSHRSVFDLFREGQRFHYVITVCDEANAERCPIFPGKTERLHWSFKDPARFEGNESQRLDQTKGVLQEIKHAVLSFLQIHKSEQ